MIILSLSYILTAVYVCKEYEIEVVQFAIVKEGSEDKKYWYSSFSTLNYFSPSHSLPLYNSYIIIIVFSYPHYLCAKILCLHNDKY